MRRSTSSTFSDGKDTLVDQIVTILENKKVNQKYFKLVFRSKQLAHGVQPGQFLNILINSSLDPLLRRPFSYYRIVRDRIEVLYEILGRGTAILADKQSGDTLKVLGPLGKPFTRSVPENRKRVLVAGGVGVPPLIYLAEKVKTGHFLIGAKSRSEVMPRKELAKVKAKIAYATNDGSYGTKGYVTVLLDRLIQEEKNGLFIQTCGPKPMMKAVLSIAREHGVPGEASLDETMACGVGACLGCMVSTDEGWLPSCTHGPVFPFEKLVKI